jgi:hypothetical protein
LSIAALNGYNNNGTNSVTVNIPPAAGNYAGKAGYAEAIITYTQPQYFSAILGNTNQQVQARAVAGGRLKSLTAGIIVLDPTGSGALSAGGNPTIDITSGAIIVDSNSASGATLVGNSTLTAPTVDLSGTPGYSISGNSNLGPGTTVLSGQPPVPDPLAYLQPPPTGPLRSSSTLNISGKQNVTLNPGLYIGGISIQGQANVTMNPGIYYMQGGGFSDTGQGSLTGNGIMIYNDGGGVINIAGQGVVMLSPLTSGPYTGLTIYQNQSSAQPVQVSGNGSMNLTGTFYAANALLQITGNGSANYIGSQYVSRDLKLGGNGTIDISDQTAPSPWTRVFGLVE